MQTYYIYPETKAASSAKMLLAKGWGQEDIENFKEQAKSICDHLHRANLTLKSCYFSPRAQYTTVWNLQISTPGHADIFDLLDAIRRAFDMNGIDEQFTYINTSINRETVSIEFTFKC